MTVSVAQGRKLLDGYLGSSIPHRNGEMSYQCPFCNHYKKKLQVNLHTQKWHCWVCDARGQTVSSLLRKSNAPYEYVKQAKDLYGDSSSNSKSQFSSRELVSLPEGYKPLYIKQSTPDYRNALHYAITERKLTLIDILRYQVGYCEEGPYAGMIVIPSYNEDNNLNYYVGRSYYHSAVTHKNPPVSKDIIGFENQINWKEPIILVEGAFDAIAVKRNAVPILGKSISKSLIKKIVSSTVEDIYIALDRDALKKALQYVEQFLNMGKKVYLVDMQDKDPSEMGFVNFTHHVQQAEEMDLGKLIRYKLSSITLSPDDARYKFDDVISGWLNRANKTGIINEFNPSLTHVTFNIEKSCLIELEKIMPTEFSLELI